MRDAKDRGDAHCDQTYATNIERGEEVRQELWSAHLNSPTFAFPEAVRKVDVWDGADLSRSWFSVLCGYQILVVRAGLNCRDAPTFELCSVFLGNCQVFWPSVVVFSVRRRSGSSDTRAVGVAFV